MKLSICMMVKDEEKNLKRCLDKVKPLVDSGLAELIIVDTGSTDNTEVISREYTDKIYFHKWNKNFSEMRNLSISYAKGEWIFIIDADERLDDLEKLITLLNTKEINKYNTIILQVKNLYNPSDENRYNLVPSPRIFKNDGRFKYEGAVHNQPIFKGPNLIVDINLTHFGYISSDKELMELKYKRTSELLKWELEKDPANLYYIYQLGVSYDMHGDYKEALNEFRKAYSVLNAQKLEEKEKYTYIYASYARIAYTNNEFKEALKIAKEALTIKKEYIDLYYLLGISEKQLGNEEDMAKYFLKYIDLLKRYNELEISKDMTIIMYHIDDKSKSTVYFQLAQYYIGLQEYKEAYKLYNNIISINEKIYAGINILIPLEKYSELRKIYNNLTASEDKNNFLCTLEDKLKNMEGYQRLGLFDEFSINEDLYGLFNKVRITNDADEKINLTKLLIKELDLNKQPVFYSEVFVNIKENIDLIIDTLKEVEAWNLKAIVKYLVEEKKFGATFEKYILENRRNLIDIKELSLFISIATMLLAIYIKDNKEISSIYLDIFKKYVKAGISFISKLYQVNKAEEIYKSIKNEEDRFFMVFYIIDKCIKSNDKKTAVKYMIEAVNLNKALSKYIDIYKDEIFNLKQTSATNEEKEQFESYKLKVKENINKLINEGNLGESKKLINEYEEIVKKDPEIYSMKAAVFIMENNLKEAESVIKEGLTIEKDNFDLNYNLGYVYECQSKFLEALDTYENIVFNMKDCDERQELIKYLNKMENVNREIIQRELESRNDYEEEKLVTNKKLNLHLMYDSPYCDKFINFINENFSKDENKFIIIHQKNAEFKYIKIEGVENVKIIDLSFELDKLLNYIDNCSIIYIHYLFDYFCELVCKFNISKPIYWPIWGGDVYNYIDFELYKPITKNVLEKIGLDLTSKIEVNNINYLYRKSTIRRIKKILRINDGEYEKVRSNFITKAYRQDFIYPIPTFNSNIMKEVAIIKNLKKRYKKFIILGNSANPTNNHLDILDELSNIENREFCVIVPLSYGGSDVYVNLIINEGKKILGDRFIPLIKYYTAEEYNYILNNVDVCLFSYNRQQGLGNIYSSIMLGKKVFMDITKYSFFGLNGIMVYNINEINGMNIEQIVKIDENIISNNKKMLSKAILNKELTKEYIEKIFKE